MANITICEDDIRDIVHRYKPLLKEHSLRILYAGEDSLESVIGSLENHGFDKDKISYPYAKSFQDAVSDDLYFIDGLRGYWHIFVSEFPKEKCYINSGDPYIRKAAKEEGINVLDYFKIPNGDITQFANEILKKT